MSTWKLEDYCNHNKVVFIATVGAFIFAILALWSTPVLTPFKLITVEGIKVDANEGGATITRGGLPWIILPAGFIGFDFDAHHLGSSFWGMVLVRASTDPLSARIAAACLVAALIIVLRIAKNICFLIFLGAIWALQETTKVRILRYVILLMGETSYVQTIWVMNFKVLILQLKTCMMISFHGEYILTNVGRIVNLAMSTTWKLQDCCNHNQVVFIATVGAFIFAILALWSTPECRKNLTLVEGIKVDANEGGATITRSGLSWIIFPAGYLGSSFWGMVLVRASTDPLSARIAAACLVAALIVLDTTIISS
ncbi:hypothetical protein GOP47_0005321 [Adiantum capillus-veneris]|uniref:Uncharacterized protein n=1 Tax=Adiantum capillus-veneris TaxID=13818 RepID=A0A9D4V6I5_ADICA|nr:hypothetical protein GOP47_0005321 [Adiantum capillus-veneris]